MRLISISLIFFLVMNVLPMPTSIAKINFDIFIDGKNMKDLSEQAYIENGTTMAI